MAQNLIVSIFGRKGSGKTFLSRKILKDFDRVVAVDTVAQYSESDGFEVFEGYEAGERALIAAERREKFRISLRSDDTEDLLRLLRLVYELQDTLVVVDEAPFYCSPSKLPPALSLIVRQGRHHKLDQIYIAQRPAEVHRSITSQSDIVVSFVQREKRDVDFLIEAGGGRDAERVSELPPYKCIAFGDGMDRCPSAILAQMHTFRGERRQLDAFEDRE